MALRANVIAVDSVWGILSIALAVTLQVLDVYTVIWFRFLVSIKEKPEV